MIMALKITALRIALCGDCSFMMFSGAMRETSPSASRG